MNILLYLDPWIDVSEKPEFKMVWFNRFLSSTIRDLVAHSNLINKFDLKIKVLYSDIAAGGDFKTNYKFIEFAYIAQNELKEIFFDFEDYITSQRSNENSQKFISLNKLVVEKLKDFVPDIILPISSMVKHLKYAFPRALILFNETGIFSRPPYPGSLYFDCSSGMDESFLLKYKDDILSVDCLDKEEKFLSQIRTFFLPVIRKHNPYNSLIGIFRRNFPKLVLLSLQRFESPLFRTQSDFRDQIEYIKHVFDSVDSNIGIIVTEHCLDRILNCPPIQKYFKNKYKNFIFIDGNEANQNSSQFLLDIVDGVITVSSTVGLQAMLHKKPLFVPSKSSYLTAFCDGQDLRKMGDFLNSNQYKNKDGALYYLLTRYYIINKYFEDGEWFYNFLCNSLENFKNGVSFSFYKKIDSDENLIKNICNEKFITAFENNLRKTSNQNSIKEKTKRIKRFKNSIKKRIKKFQSWL